ncbi:tetratricopeptide repeat protein [Methanolobus sp. ZRKC2]|uniref:tetratricopeptide repeat protein n=1 Tax=Methanolobus sp. ZRKC2 TaxID=3125783 RepID=UPI003244DFFA
MGMMDEVKTKKKLKAAETWFKMAENAKTEEKQIEYYTKSLDANPYNAEAWFRMGRAMEKIGHFNDAQKSFDHAIEIDPDYQGLIGRKTNSVESSEFSGETNDFPELSEVEDTYQTAETDDEWITENPESENTGFNPPIGDESIFSGIGSNNEEEVAHDTFSSAVAAPDDDNLSKNMVHEAEQEMTFTTTSGMEEEAVAPVSGNETAFRSVNTSDPVSSYVSDVKEEASLPKSEEMEIPAKKSKPDRLYTESATVSETGVSGGINIVDIRIPLNETLRFWLIGIVAIIIAFKILEFI